MAAKDRVLKDYKTQFDPQNYLKYYTEVTAWLSYPVKAAYGSFQSSLVLLASESRTFEGMWPVYN